ncbi:MAG: succinylglutamate desuccinylase/aspartoacylase family protein [Gemmatimonadota bacterium]
MEHYPIEISPPDIQPFRRGNTGVDYVHVLDSGRPGPTVMVQALTHGNEFCGALALDYLLREQVQPLRGRLILAFANVDAYARFDFDAPDASRYVDEDYNRVWADDALFGPRDSAELRRARQLQPFVDAADFLLDLHSMHEPCRPIMVCGRIDKNAQFARDIGVPADLLIDTGHPAGLRMIERGGFGDPASARRAVLIECGQHWERSAADVAIDTLVRFLAVTGVVDAAWTGVRLRLPLPAAQRLVRVTEAVVARSMDFRFLVPIVGLGIVERAGTPIAQDGEHVWRAPYEHTVLVMPSLRHLRPGNTQVRLGRYD